MKYLVFTISSFRLALDITKVIEIIIPGAGGSTSPEKIITEKVMKYQDKMIPITNLAETIFNIPPAIPSSFRVVLSELDGKPVGLLVDNADEIISLSDDQIKTTKKYASALKTDFIESKFVEDEKDIYILAPNKILSAIKTV